MKAKVKYQEIDYIQYDGTNRKEVEEFIGESCNSCDENINKPLVPWIHFEYDDNSYDVYRSQYVIKANDKVIGILWKSDFFRLFEPVND